MNGYSVPHVWMKRLCSGSISGVLNLYTDDAVLVPTYDKSDLPGAGKGVLVGKPFIAHYFQRFMAKPGLCGRILSCVPQTLGPVEVVSGLYTFCWQPGGLARARYTIVSVNGLITTHHSSEAP